MLYCRVTVHYYWFKKKIQPLDGSKSRIFSLCFINPKIHWMNKVSLILKVLVYIIAGYTVYDVYIV